VNREVHARFWERAEVKFLRATRHFAAKISGFAVCGENLASVSQFVAGIRRGRSFGQENDEEQ